jgi:hypothetical protein
VPGKVKLRKLCADGKALQSNYNEGKFLNDLVVHAPMLGVIQDIRLLHSPFRFLDSSIIEGM